MTTKKHNIPEVSIKSTKDQILAAYSEVLTSLNEKQIAIPEEQKKQEEKKEVVSKAASHSSDDILADLSTLKSRTIKKVDSLSEELLSEFQKLANLREAIILEQKHLQELYQINETANTLSALLQAQAEQKERFKLEMEQTKENFGAELADQKFNWQQQSTQLEQDYKEQKANLEKTRKREEEEYNYALELKRRKETDEYNNKKASLEKELSDLKDNLLKREADLATKEQDYDSFRIQVEQIPNQIKEEVTKAEELLRSNLLQQYEFEKQMKQKEYDGLLKLKEQSVHYLEDKINKQEARIKELTDKADNAAQQVQLIACRALDTSAGRVANMNATSKFEEKNQ
ncbi:MAG: hypothetical protein K9G65_06030 [Rickettsiaceae bacterium]|nr:hypothetical protein [Rickettsiaceae bacterium]